MKILKRYLVTACVILLILAVVFAIFKIRSCREKVIEKAIELEGNASIPEGVYRPPVVEIPFIRNKNQPVKERDLPIPKKNIEKTISVKLSGARPLNFSLVVDKKGHIYKTKDSPKDVEINIVKWKPKLLEFRVRPGYSLAYSNGLYHCLSLDLMRIWEIYFGADIGLGVKEQHVRDFLFGMSAKGKIFTLRFSKVKADVSLVLGWNLLSNKTYFGGSVAW